VSFKSLIRWRLKKDSMSDESPERKIKSEIHELIRSLDLDANQKQELHSRTEQYEGKVLDEFLREVKQKYQTPKEESKQITEGKTEPHHIGEKSPEVLQQEIFSLMNTKPAFRDKEWLVKWESLSEQINNIKDARIKRRLKEKARAMHDGEN